MSADFAIHIDSVHMFVQFVGHQLFLVREVQKYNLNDLNHIFFNFSHQKKQMTVNYSTMKKMNKKREDVIIHYKRIKIF